MNENRQIVMDVLDRLEAFARGLGDGTVDERDLDPIRENWSNYVMPLIEDTLAEDVDLSAEEEEAIVDGLDTIFELALKRMGNALQKQLNDESRVRLVGDVVFGIGMLRSVLYWRLSRG